MIKVLVVDDSPIDRRFAGRLLEKQGEFAVCYAENGFDALARLETESPDVILTDLRMPEMDGLELVESARTARPLTPVVLMTAHGSEDVARRALMMGAASYVPKAELAQRLRETVESVAAAARADRRHARLFETLSENSWTFRLDDDPELILPLVDHFRGAITALDLFDETDRIRLSIALEEALKLAVTGIGSSPTSHASEPPPFTDGSRSERVEINVRGEFTREACKITIARKGKAFAWPGDLTRSESDNYLVSQDRGLTLIRMFLDDVSVNERGDELTLVKRLAAQSSLLARTPTGGGDMTR